MEEQKVERSLRERLDAIEEQHEKTRRLLMKMWKVGIIVAIAIFIKA